MRNVFFLASFVSLYTVEACLHIPTCQYPHYYDPKILIEVDNDTTETTDHYLYDFSLLYRNKTNFNPYSTGTNEHMQKATRYFELKKFEKCLEHIKICEKHSYIYNNVDLVGKGKLLAYKAYSPKCI